MTRTKCWILAGLVLMLPGLGRADEVEVPPYTAVPPCLDTSGNPAVGTVVAVTGEVSIASPQCAPVPAECGTAVHTGEFLTTGPGAQVALLADGRYVQVAGDSRVDVRTSGDGATRVAVERGTARVIDVGTGAGPALVVATPALETRDPGADVVASVTAPGVSSICSYADPIEVRGGDRVSTVAPGSCAGVATNASPVPTVTAIAGGGGAVTLPVSIASVGRCDVAAGPLVPTDVASGPPEPPLPPTPPPPPPPPYCQGNACLPPPPPPPTRNIIEQPVIPEPPPD